MESSLFDRYKFADNLITKAVKLEYASDVLKIDMKEFFKPKDKKEEALLFGTFSKYNHDKITDAFLVCQKGFKNIEETMKYKSLLYLTAIIRKLK